LCEVAFDSAPAVTVAWDSCIVHKDKRAVTPPESSPRLWNETYQRYVAWAGICPALNVDATLCEDEKPWQFKPGDGTGVHTKRLGRKIAKHKRASY
jgi:hypothetical protein